MRDHSLWRGWAQQGQGGGQSRPLKPPWPRPGRGQSGWWGWVSSLRSSACTCVPHLEAVACWPGPGAGAGEGTLVGGAHRAGELGRGGDKCCYYLQQLQMRPGGSVAHLRSGAAELARGAASRRGLRDPAASAAARPRRRVHQQTRPPGASRQPAAGTEYLDCRLSRLRLCR